jgi:hypothetical protein
MGELMKKMLLVLVLVLSVFSSEVFAGPKLNIGRYVLDGEGKLVTMGQEEAAEYCAKHHSRLPTNREWAEYAAANGARGIKETAFPDVSVTAPGRSGLRQEMEENRYTYDWIFVAKNPGVLLWTMDFYYSARGYKEIPEERELLIKSYHHLDGWQRPDRDKYSEKWVFWTSSPAAENSAWFFTFNAVNGDLEVYADGPLHVRCAKRRHLFQ